jgi:hypothetical protein
VPAHGVKLPRQIQHLALQLADAREVARHGCFVELNVETRMNIRSAVDPTVGSEQKRLPR